MKKPLFLIILSFFISISFGQPGGQQESLNAGKPAERKIYKLSGERHGVNYFPQVRLKQVEYEAGDSLNFDCYHSAEVIYAWLKRWSEKYPDIVKLYEVGRSYENRPIYQITVSNTKTGKDTDKPAAFLKGDDTAVRSRVQKPYYGWLST